MRMRMQTDGPLRRRWLGSEIAQPACETAWRFLTKPHISSHMISDCTLGYFISEKWKLVFTQMFTAALFINHPDGLQWVNDWAHCRMLLGEKMSQLRIFTATRMDLKGILLRSSLKTSIKWLYTAWFCLCNSFEMAQSQRRGAGRWVWRVEAGVMRWSQGRRGSYQRAAGGPVWRWAHSAPWLRRHTCLHVTESHIGRVQASREVWAKRAGRCRHASTSVLAAALQRTLSRPPNCRGRVNGTWNLSVFFACEFTIISK